MECALRRWLSPPWCRPGLLWSTISTRRRAATGALARRGRTDVVGSGHGDGALGCRGAVGCPQTPSVGHDRDALGGGYPAAPDPTGWASAKDGHRGKPGALAFGRRIRGDCFGVSLGLAEVARTCRSGARDRKKRVI